MENVAMVNVRLPLWGRSFGRWAKHPRKDQKLEKVLDKNVKVQFRQGSRSLLLECDLLFIGQKTCSTLVGNFLNVYNALDIFF